MIRIIRMNTKTITVLLLVMLASFSPINNTLCGCQQVRTHALSMTSRIFSSLSINKTKIALGALTIAAILYGIKKSYWKNNSTQYKSDQKPFKNVKVPNDNGKTPRYTATVAKETLKSGDPQVVNYKGKKVTYTITVEK